MRRFRQFSDILGLTPRAERCYAPMLAECYIVFLRSILGHPKGIAAVLAAPHADTVEGHLVPLQDVVVALVGYDKRVVAEDPATWTSPLAALARPWLDEETMYDLFLKIKKVAERGKKSIKDAGDHPVPALDVEDALELLLDAVFRAAARGALRGRPGRVGPRPRRRPSSGRSSPTGSPSTGASPSTTSSASSRTCRARPRSRSSPSRRSSRPSRTARTATSRTA